MGVWDSMVRGIAVVVKGFVDFVNFFKSSDMQYPQWVEDVLGVYVNDSPPDIIEKEIKPKPVKTPQDVGLDVSTNKAPIIVTTEQTASKAVNTTETAAQGINSANVEMAKKANASLATNTTGTLDTTQNLLAALAGYGGWSENLWTLKASSGAGWSLDKALGTSSYYRDAYDWFMNTEAGKTLGQYKEWNAPQLALIGNLLVKIHRYMQNNPDAPIPALSYGDLKTIEEEFNKLGDSTKPKIDITPQDNGQSSNRIGADSRASIVNNVTVNVQGAEKPREVGEAVKKSIFDALTPITRDALYQLS